MDYIFSDFDGTITKNDAIHSFITSFSKGDSSIAEGMWCRGEITSKECYEIQFKLIDGLKKTVYDEFINSIEIDPYFKDFYLWANKNNKKIVIVSDGLDAFIEPILKKNDIKLPVFSNHLKIEEKFGGLYFNIEYPNIYKSCEIGIGTCKCAAAKSRTDNFVYIGDGLSDRCIAKKAKIVFAKKSLLKCCIKENINYIPFENFSDILNAFINRCL